MYRIAKEAHEEMQRCSVSDATPQQSSLAGGKIRPVTPPNSKPRVLHKKANQVQKKKVHIINYIDFEKRFSTKAEDRKKTTRQGASKDSENLKTTFEKIGYEVSLKENLTEDETDYYLDDIQDDTSLEALVLIILSHGRDEDTFYTSDYQDYSLTQVQYRFNDPSCPHLKGLPKVIMSNFCRGEITEKFKPVVISDHNVPEGVEEPPHGMITIMASHAGFEAIRSKKRGTVFVQNLCEVLNEEKDIPVHEVFNEIYYRISTDKGQTPEMKVSAPFPIFHF